MSKVKGLKPVYHGWVVRQDNGDGKLPSYFAEFKAVEGQGLQRVYTGDSAAKAVQFWDDRIGQPVKLLPTPIGAFRVFTLVEDEVTNG